MKLKRRTFPLVSQLHFAKATHVAVLSVLLTNLSFSAFAQRTNIPNDSDQLITSNAVVAPIAKHSGTTQVSRAEHQPRIQIAILLDTSSSMDGLLDQTRNQLWSVVNEFSGAKQQGKKPILEVALYEYGNDSNAMQNNYIRQLTGFTRELDKVSESLFSLRTNGGSEFCGAAIQSAVNELQWSTSNSDIKSIFIAGNEAFTQGPIHFKQAITVAKQKGIAVNTIFAGRYQEGLQSGWQSGAELAGGDYMSIDADRQVVHVSTPQDKEIAQLNAQLNSTYIPYGNDGKQKARRQMEQDKRSESIASGLLAKRVKSKSSDFYNNSQWDLVDAVKDGKMDEQQLAEIETEDLPEVMQPMALEERKKYIKTQTEARENIKQAIAKLSEKREEYVAAAKQAEGEQSKSMSDALSAAVKKQAKLKSFELSAEATQ